MLHVYMHICTLSVVATTFCKALNNKVHTSAHARTRKKNRLKSSTRLGNLHNCNHNRYNNKMQYGSNNVIVESNNDDNHFQPFSTIQFQKPFLCNKLAKV